MLTLLLVFNIEKNTHLFISNATIGNANLTKDYAFWNTIVSQWNTVQQQKPFILTKMARNEVRNRLCCVPIPIDLLGICSNGIFCSTLWTFTIIFLNAIITEYNWTKSLKCIDLSINHTVATQAYFVLQCLHISVSSSDSFISLTTSGSCGPNLFLGNIYIFSPNTQNWFLFPTALILTYHFVRRSCSSTLFSNH